MVTLVKEIYAGEIPIFLSADDNYLPFLDVTLRSLIANASREYQYKIIILNTGLNPKSIEKIEALEDENFSIEFADISPAVSYIKYKLPNYLHFGLATWYRLFIQSLFPQYDKILYIDCDVVVLDDISKLYFTDISNYNIAGVVENWILHSPIFSHYTKEAVGIESENYINAGIMVMNLAAFRRDQIEEQFVHLINTYNFDVIDPDQAYINYLCRDKIKYLPFEWNRTPIESVECASPKIVHYALGDKPWHNPDMFLGEYFWQYAKDSSFIDEITKMRDEFDAMAMLKKQRAGIDIQIRALEVAQSDNTFKRVLAENRKAC